MQFKYERIPAAYADRVNPMDHRDGTFVAKRDNPKIMYAVCFRQNGNTVCYDLETGEANVPDRWVWHWMTSEDQITMTGGK